MFPILVFFIEIIWRTDTPKAPARLESDWRWRGTTFEQSITIQSSKRTRFFNLSFHLKMISHIDAAVDRFAGESNWWWGGKASRLVIAAYESERNLLFYFDLLQSHYFTNRPGSQSIWNRIRLVKKVDYFYRTWKKQNQKWCSAYDWEKCSSEMIWINNTHWEKLKMFRNKEIIKLLCSEHHRSPEKRSQSRGDHEWMLDIRAFLKF